MRPPYPTFKGLFVHDPNLFFLVLLTSCPIVTNLEELLEETEKGRSPNLGQCFYE